ncbi:MAG: RNA polymerase sigma factor [Bacteriovoracaceae bacterium]|nr:RNA polymerase sigma factor [Bacteriovoracaceae bacterium]
MPLKNLKKLFGQSFVPYSDEDLVELVSKNQTGAFEELYDRYKVSLFSYVASFGGKLKAEDNLQEIFLKIILKSASFRRESKAKTWIWTLARNFMIDQQRLNEFKVNKNSYSTDLEGEDLLESVCDETTDIENSYLQKLEVQKLLDCMEELPLNHKEILLAKIQSDLSYEELAIMNNQKVSALKSLLFRMKSKLMDCFQRHGSQV